MTYPPAEREVSGTRRPLRFKTGVEINFLPHKLAPNVGCREFSAGRKIF